MNSHRNEAHLLIVKQWDADNATDLQAQDLVTLYALAFHVLCERTLATLSSITVQVVIERVLHEGATHFEVLANVRTQEDGFNFSGLIENHKNYSAADIRSALQNLLSELLSVIGNITAEILTKSLHAELMTVTAKIFLNEEANLNLHQMLTKSNRDRT